MRRKRIKGRRSECGPIWNRKNTADAVLKLTQELGHSPTAVECGQSLANAIVRYWRNLNTLKRAYGLPLNRGGRKPKPFTLLPIEPEPEPEPEWWENVIDLNAERKAHHKRMAQKDPSDIIPRRYTRRDFMPQVGRKHSHNRLDRPAEYLPPDDVTKVYAWWTRRAS